MVSKVLRVCLAPKETQELSASLVSRAMLVCQVYLERTVYRGPGVLQACQVAQVSTVSRVPLATRALWVSPAFQVNQVKTDDLVSKAFQVPRATRDLEAYQVNPGHQGSVDRRERREKEVTWAHRVSPVQQQTKANAVPQGPEEPPDWTAAQGPQDPKAYQDLRDEMPSGPQDPWENQGPRDPQGFRGSMENQVPKEPMVWEDSPASREIRASAGLQVFQATSAFRFPVPRASQVLRGRKVIRVSTAEMDPKETQDSQVALVLTAYPDLSAIMVFLVLLACQVPWDRKGLQVSQVWMV